MKICQGFHRLGMVGLASLTMLLAAGSPMIVDATETRTYRVAGYNVFACKDVGDLQYIGDSAGNMMSDRASHAMRRCQLFDRGEELIVERYDDLRQMYLARLRDDSSRTGSFWFNEKNVEKR